MNNCTKETQSTPDNVEVQFPTHGQYTKIQLAAQAQRDQVLEIAPYEDLWGEGTDITWKGGIDDVHPRIYACIYIHTNTHTHTHTHTGDEDYYRRRIGG
jgi:hypothetical protein